MIYIMIDNIPLHSNSTSSLYNTRLLSIHFDIGVEGIATSGSYKFAYETLLLCGKYY